MFISAVAATLLLFAFLTLRERIKYTRLTSPILKKALKQIAEQMALNEWEAAEKGLRLLLAKGKGGREALLLLVHILRTTKRYEEGLALTLTAARDYPEELAFRLEEAKIFLEMKKPEEAIAAFRVCAPILRSESDYYECALAHFQTGQIKTCWELIEGRVASSQNEKLFALAGNCQFEFKQYSEAVLFYESAVKNGSVNPMLMNQLGHAYRKLGNLSLAEQIFRHVLEKEGADISATLGVGSCLQERGLHLKALLFYQSGAAWEKKDPRVLFQAGLCALITKRFHYSSLYFSEVSYLQEPTAQLLFYYGVSLEGEHKWQEAEQTYLQLVKAFPADVKGYRALAWLYGVGFSATLSAEQGLSFAYVALKALPDFISWEIVSACEARQGNFQRAHQIQEYLLSFEEDSSARIRRQHAMRNLRKHLPLDDQYVLRSQVA